MFDPITILAGLLPLGVEAGKAAIQRWLAPDQAKPLDFNQVLELKRLELEQWKAMQGGDAPSYQWVAAIRQLQRPLFAAAVVLAWCGQAVAGEPSPTVANMAAAVGFYLFGDRTLFYIKGGAK
jgi:dsRNA-specific ribonuclease